MSKEYKLEVEKRTIENKKDLKELRQSGKIPGIYYSYDSKDSLPFLIEKDDGRILNATITKEGYFLEKYSYLNNYISS